MVRQAKLDRTNRMKTMTMQAIACAVAMGCMGGFAAEYFVLKDGGIFKQGTRAAVLPMLVGTPFAVGGCPKGGQGRSGKC